MSKVIEPTTDTLGRDLAWLELSPEEQERTRLFVQMQMECGWTPDAKFEQETMAEHTQWCIGCPRCFSI